ncbi:transposase [uncultured Lamprocystis sp.]|jgi:putative transposase|uniref:REP-associated tyrosine transposase n=1 Tax=uncultured Lamprocystis sp. TaxID=543132 RepID=UPI0025DBBF03|nr:transposase [uncultured Lamprocystis sp.]
MLTRGLHVPAHLLLDDHWYFLTGAIHEKRHLLDDQAKDHLLATFSEVLGQAGWALAHWVILDNHYHLLTTSRRGCDLPRIMRAVHGQTGFAIRQRTGCALPVWWNYWDYCPRDEQDYYRHLNYLLWNPVKHGYVARLGEWPFSSFHDWLDAMGSEQLKAQFRGYPDFRELAVEDDF